MEVACARPRLTHVPLGDASPFLAHEAVLAIVSKAPRVVLLAAHVDLAELGRAGVSENRVVQFSVVKAVAEIHVEGVLRIAGAAAEAASDARAAVDGKLRCPRGIDVFHRNRPLPKQTVPAGVRVDATCYIGEVRDVCAHAHGRDGGERGFQALQRAAASRDVGERHAVAECLAIYRGAWKAKRRGRRGRLIHDVVDEQEAVRLDAT